VAADPARKIATYQDVLDAPEHLVAEIVRGNLSLMPRPRPIHARAASRLGMALAGFDGASDEGPGGWLILDEPELHLGPEVIVPDLGGWRRERMPEMPTTPAWFELAPDWCCEVLSPSTERLDRGDKTEIYAEHRVGHLWLVNPELQMLEVLVLDGSTYRHAKTFVADAKVRAEPFEALEIDLARLWAR
jgi:Uma2 family endonuclease